MMRNMNKLMIAAVMIAANVLVCWGQSWTCTATGSFSTHNGTRYVTQFASGIGVGPNKTAASTSALSSCRRMGNAKGGVAVCSITSCELSNAKGGNNTAAPAKTTPKASAKPSASKSYGGFTADDPDEFNKKIAEELGDTKTDRDQIFKAATQATDLYEGHPSTSDWLNNVSGAMAYFLILTTDVYSGRATAADRWLFQKGGSDEYDRAFKNLSKVLDSEPSFENLSDNDKQMLYHKMLLTGAHTFISKDKQFAADAIRKYTDNSHEDAVELVRRAKNAK